MSLRLWIIKKLTVKPITQGAISEQNREKALMVRRTEHAIKQKEKEMDFLERIINIETKINPKEDITESLIKQVLPILLAKIQAEKNPNSVTGESVTTTAGIIMTDSEIKLLVQNNPKLVKYAKKFSDEEIQEYIIQQSPNLSKETIEKIIVEVKA